MKSKNITPVLLGFSLFLGTLSMARASERSPPGSKPLSAILESVDGQSLGVITGTDFDNGWWKVKVCNAGACQKLYIDPKSGGEQRRRNTDSDEALPPANAKPLSEIVRLIEARGPGLITEVEFDDGFWEVELRQDRRKLKLVVDPRTGETKR